MGAADRSALSSIRKINKAFREGKARQKVSRKKHALL